MKENKVLPFDSNSCQELLKGNILSFWSEKMVDDMNGGFYGRIDGNDILDAEANKGIILNARILWAFSAAFQEYQDPIYLNNAKRAYHYIADHFIDHDNGGVYWMVDFMGMPADTKKQIYALAFVIYAFAEYYKITRQQSVLDASIELFELVEKYSFDKDNHGYLEAFDQNWNLLDDLRLSEKENNDAKTMNTHLHILEAYTNLYRVWSDETLKRQLELLILLFLEKFISESGHFHLFFNENWQLKSTKFSFGHDIEGAWLLHEAAVVLGDQDLIIKCEQAAIKMTNAALQGLDDDGGLMNEGVPGQIEDSDKHWWPQAEALVGLINAWQISGDDAFRREAQRVWDFTTSKIIDFENGEWHWMTNKEGVIDRDEDKAGPWKCPYHNGRAMLELIHRLDT